MTLYFENDALAKWDGEYFPEECIGDAFRNFKLASGISVQMPHGLHIADVEHQFDLRLTRLLPLGGGVQQQRHPGPRRVQFDDAVAVALLGDIAEMAAVEGGQGGGGRADGVLGSHHGTGCGWPMIVTHPARMDA